MKIQDIKKKAKEMGIKPNKMKKAELIKTIQKTEGNTDCFGTAVDKCDQSDCCWKDDCIKGGSKNG